MTNFQMPNLQSHDQNTSRPFTFSHRVRIMRNLHPDVGKAGDSEMLPTKLTKWRRQCEQAMNYNGYGTHSQFGGLFKEALSCACLSRRTYKLLDNIMTKHNDLHISFKGNMIRGISGCYDELYIFSVLRQVDDGVIGPQEMNESLIKEKNTRECRPSPDDPDAKQELAVLRAEVAKLRRELSQKAQKVASLEEELAKTKQTGHNGEARRDIFNFESPIPGNRTCRYSRPVFAPDSDSDDVSLGAGSSISDLENTNDLHANTFLQDNDIFTNNSLPDINMEPEMSSTPTSNSIIDEHHNESLTTTNCNMISNPELDDIFLTPEATILKPIPSETVIRGQAESNTHSRTRRSSKKRKNSTSVTQSMPCLRIGRQGTILRNFTQERFLQSSCLVIC
ncbi:uncharacterized protein LOC128224934 isoform X2 [Mya arenaria]|uniref:uncharacterized protein LOC128224934 isoform X2 n=1 Tax=Mya arenaria TaxID=6604 RepID=UPI0022E0F158|nr:uncharacterized protein LOC128224934 isoform X2 [Mya arenaria]